MRNNKLLISFIVGITIFVIGLFLIPKPVCRDGWASSSIGISGACSHHGGVDNHQGYWLLDLIASVGFGYLIYYLLREIGYKQSENEKYNCKIIRTAINNKKKLSFIYLSKKGSESTRREVIPHLISRENNRYFKNESLCLSGYCELRKERRTFLIENMRDVKII